MMSRSVFSRIGLLAVLSLAALATPSFAQFQTDRDRAEALLGVEDLAPAEAFLRQAVARNRDDGLLWFYFGYALAEGGDCPAALPAFDQALALGVNGDRNGLYGVRLRQAECLAALGRNREALDALAEVYWRWGSVDFDAVESEPAYAQLIRSDAYRSLKGELPPGLSREAGWLSDIDRLETLMQRRHLRGPAITGSAGWQALITQLRQNVARSSDLQMVSGLMRLAALGDDGHTVIYPPGEGALGFHLLPVQLYRFADGWRIMAAAPDHAALLGARLEAIGGVPIDQAEQGVFAHLARDNRYTLYWLGSVGLQFAELSALVSQASATEPIEWTVRLADGSRQSITLPGQDIARDPMAILPPPDWPRIYSEDLPLWLSRLDEPFWLTELPDISAIYAQVNAVTNTDEESLAGFAARLGERASNGETIILDLRHNRGGNGYLIEGFMRPLLALPQSQQRGKVFVLIGRRTFSAAGELTGTLGQLTRAVFVGEPTAARPTLYAGDTPFTLPYSGLQGSISSHYFVNALSSDDVRPWFAPDIHAAPSLQDFIAGRDPALEAIRMRLAEPGQAPRRFPDQPI